MWFVFMSNEFEYVGNYGIVIVSIAVYVYFKLNHIYCNSIISTCVGANPLYGVMWSHSESNILTFTCVMACRTSTIRGCAVFLFHNVSHSTHASQSDQLSGNLEEVESRNSTIQFVNVSLSNPITYIAVTIPTDVSPVLGEHLEGTISLDNFIS